MADFDLRIDYVPLHQLAPAPRNPKSHDLGALHSSLDRFGFVAPIIINEGTGRIVAGHGRAEALLQAQTMGMKPPKRVKVLDNGDWAVPVIRGVAFATDKEAEAYLLADNRITELGGYDDTELTAMLKEMALTDPASLVGTGFDPDDVEAMIRKLDAGTPMFTAPPSPIPMTAPPLSPTEEAAKKAAGTSRAGVTRPDMTKPNPVDTLPPVPAELQELFDAKEGIAFSGDSNIFEIPDLLPDMLVQSLPEKLDTFAGDATPDDGDTTWLYIYGSYSPERIASFGNRVMVSFFTDDARFESWWELPAYHLAKLYRMGIRMAMVPDFSNWDGDPRILHLWNIYRAQWIGRYMQEVGVRVIPRLISADPADPIKNLATIGCPKHAPVVAMQLQAAHKSDPEEARETIAWYRHAVQAVEPDVVLVYCNPAGRAMVEEHGLGGAAVRYVDSFMQKRAMKMKAQAVAEDDDLKQLKEAERARKRNRRRGGGDGGSE